MNYRLTRKEKSLKPSGHPASRKAASPGYSGLGEASVKLLAEVVLKFLGLYPTIAPGVGR